MMEARTDLFLGSHPFNFIKGIVPRVGTATNYVGSSVDVSNFRAIKSTPEKLMASPLYLFF